MKSQVGNLSSYERIGSAIVGAVLSVLALRRGNPILRSVEAAAGASLLARSIAGHCAVKAALTGASSLGDGLRDQWSHMAFSGLAEMVGSGRSADHIARSKAVDESGEQSFPASDPPASRLPDEPPSNAEAKWAAARAAKQAGPPL